MASNAPSPLPRFVYKITPSAPPEPLPAVYPPSELDQNDGFVHLSTGPQIPITAGLWFKDTAEFWIIKIRLAGARFEKDINWDVPGCPHLYGNFGAEDVDSVRKFNREQGQVWDQVLEPSVSWLE
ncbi:hypothetical protein MAPG_02899 [Magnaporthiopsis poae ATCC 64411]|uniref:DUF952 domain-containing protein n=1 Tax=Magnaporthiopsis poae (strain ATCC 64411 / 73-15) TaxID=644358 RepID=A0A0C4DSL7_MAGP6|nr:hypothetical protein MAPG_02899 [Magnaporthiopsis poae ATCC 64411]